MDGADETARGWRGLVGVVGLAPLAIICFGVWLHAADNLLIATMMPKIVADIGGARLVSWTIALYEIGSIVAGAAGAYLSLRFGLRPPMAGAAFVYMGGCAVSALAPDMATMLVGRLAQGLGGGGLMALSLISVSRLFPRHLVPHAMAAISAFWGVSAFLGPLVGGLFADAGHWRGGFWVFAAQAGALVLAAGASSALARTGAAGISGGMLPLRRLGVLSAGVVAIAFGGIEIDAVLTPLCVLSGLLLILLFLAMDGRGGERRLWPKRPLDPRIRVGAGLLMVLLISAATVPLGIYGPLLMTRLHGISALQAGYVLALESVSWSVTAILVARIPETATRRIIVSGMAVVVFGVAGFVFAFPAGSVLTVVVFAACQGAGFGMAWTFVLSRLTAIAEEGERERVAGALTTLQQLGYALGAAYCGIAANAAGFSDRMSLPETRHAAFWIFAAVLPLAFAGLLASARFVRDRER